jgi:hypothetical protein
LLHILPRRLHPLLHGSDRRLVFVTEFDPATGAFHYQVNQHFGAASGPLNRFRIPFVLTL